MARNWEIEASKLSVKKTYENYVLAEYQGKLGIWATYTETVNWVETLKQPLTAELILLEQPIKLADLMDDDAGHLLDPEFEGVFECRAQNLIWEGQYLAKTETY